jgi:DNA-binding CsgD family transcriptional regulator
MGRDRTDQAAPDLFSTTNAVREASATSTKPISATEAIPDTPSQRHILPKNLRHAVKQLSDGELDELFEVVFDEGKRRGRLPRNVETNLAAPPSRRPSELVAKRSPVTDKSQRRKVDIAEVSLTQGQVNAVRAAFKAGITPSRIARQFGISQANVRKALASDPSK